MRLVHGYSSIMASCASGWKSPLSSPTLALAASRVATLVWAFQQQGWAACIPGIAALAGKLRKLRWSDLVKLLGQAVSARTAQRQTVSVRRGTVGRSMAWRTSRRQHTASVAGTDPASGAVTRPDRRFRGRSC